MAAIAMKLHLCTILTIFSLHLSSTSAAEVSLRELDSAISALRSHGYNLFGNSLSVTDLSFRVLTSSSNAGFTFLAPPNSALFSLDMSTDAFTYIHSLRFHLIPRRLSFSDLKNLSLSSLPYLETLAGGHLLSVSSSGGDTVSVDGVRVSVPDLFLRSKIAIHGLDGILVSATEEYFQGASSISMPPVDAFSPENQEVLSPSPTISPLDGSVCADWSNCDQEVMYPNVWPPIGSISLTPAGLTPEMVPEEAWEQPSNPPKESRKQEHKKKHIEFQIPDEGDTNFATYEHSSSL